MNAKFRCGSTIVGAILCGKVTSYVYSRNQLTYFYPPEADSISIPILLTQFILALLMIVLLPSIVLGNEKFKKWAKSGSKLRFILIVAIASIAYFLASVLELMIVASGADKNHWEILASMSVLVGCTGYFLYRDIQWVFANSNCSDGEILIKN